MRFFAVAKIQNCQRLYLQPMQKPETTTALFFKPSRLKQRWSPFEFIHISKTGNGIGTAKEPLDERLVRKHFPAISNADGNLLAALGDEALAAKVSELTRTHAKQKAGTALSSFVDRSFLRQVHQQLKASLKAVSGLKTYHQVSNPATGNPLTTACSITATEPVLHFRVERSADEAIHLISLLDINGNVYALSELEREIFFLRSENTYSLLRFADYQILQWLSANDPEDYARDPAGFSEHILAKLSADYQIDSAIEENFIPIDVKPVCAVYLSEISNAFLMLTPRWNYDGFWVEGPWQLSERINKNGQWFELRRNRKEEEAFVSYLQSLHPLFNRQLNAVFHLSFAEANKKHWFLKAYHQLLGKDVELLGMAFLKHYRYAPDPLETSLKILQTEGLSVQAEIRLNCGKELIDPGELQKLLLSGQRSLLLKDHSILLLSDEWLLKYSVYLKHGHIKGNMLTIPQWLFLGVEGDAVVSPPTIREAWWKRWKLWQETETELYPIPAAINAVLRPYQRKGYEWLCLLHELDAGACLADDMGLGKTLQTICFLAKLLTATTGTNASKKKVVLIVCPASLLYNWRLEVEKFAPSLKTSIYHESSRNLDDFFSVSEVQVLITSYGTLRSDFDLLQAIEWEAVVLDESHTIKNPAAQITKAVYQLRSKARIALSGTPVMNNSVDLYAQLQFLVPGLLGSLEFFRREYAIPIDRDQDQEKILALQKLTAAFLLRRTKKQVATDLPPKTESILWCEMGTEQKALYDETLTQIRESLFLNIKKEGIGKNKLSILQGMQKLRQICAAPGLLAGNETVPAVKAAVLLEILTEKRKENKVLVFSQFKGVLHLLADGCRKSGIDYYHFDGDTAASQRMAMVEAFQSPGNEVNVFLISLKAGNTGLTLTAADLVYLVDPWWNTAVQQQAIDRAYRIGQTKAVFAYQMICKDSIEEKIIALQQRKRSLSDALVSEENAFMKTLTEEELAFLFS